MSSNRIDPNDLHNLFAAWDSPAAIAPLADPAARAEQVASLFPWAPSLQQEAILAWCRNPSCRALFVEALPGTGKTTTILRAIADSLPGDVWFGAFGKAISEEIDKKLEPVRKLRQAAGDPGGAVSSTWHSMGYRILSEWRRFLGIGPLEMDDRKYERLFADRIYRVGPGEEKSQGAWEVRPGLQDLERDLRKVGGVKFLAWWFDMAQQSGLCVRMAGEYEVGSTRTHMTEVLKHFLGKRAPLMIAWEAYSLIIQPMLDSLLRLAQTKTVTYTDLVWLPLILNDQHLLEIPQFDWVLVDEGQDTSAIRGELGLRMRKPQTGRIVVVGDRHQAIFGFTTGAATDAMQELRERVVIADEVAIVGRWLTSDERLAAKGTDADVGGLKLVTTLPLSITRRCPRVVVEFTRQWAPEFEAAPDAPEGIMEELSEEVFWEEVSPVQSDPTGTLSLYARRMRWLAAPQDVAILCRLNAPLLKIFYELILLGIPARIEGRDIAAKLIGMVQQMADRGKLGLQAPALALMDRLVGWQHRIKASACSPNPRRLCTQEDGAVLDSLLCLITIIGRLEPDATIADLLRKLDSLFSDSIGGGEEDEEEEERRRRRRPAVTLSSFHKAKGLEWREVVVWGRRQMCPVGWAMEPWELEQEEWLQFVALTRTKERLVEVDVEDRRRGGRDGAGEAEEVE